MSKNVVVISGPTGSGESTITKEVIRRFPRTVVRLVTATSRPPRDSEQNGVDYFFFSKEEFLRHQKNGTIVEAGYIPNRDAYYGTHLPDLEQKLAAGLTIIANTQIVGTKYYKENYRATSIFIEPESIDLLEERIRARSPGLTGQEIMSRLDDAKREIREEGPIYDYHVINAEGKLDQAVDAVIEIFRKEGYTLS